MPSQRTILSALAIAGLAALSILSNPAPALAAQDEPPFELRFPQELSATDFSSTFGAGRSSGRRHQGNDLMAPKMTEVYAVADGVVETVRSSGNAGRYLVIAHESGWTSSYMHLNNDTPGTDNGRGDWRYTLAPGIDVGTSVAAGDLIAWVGDSGNAEWTGSHTHFELRHNGRAVNPYGLLAEAFRQDEARALASYWPTRVPNEIQTG
jgi:murein DD-endopeptidase MepM/ murein hydrolase activator NlpD